MRSFTTLAGVITLILAIDTTPALSAYTPLYSNITNYSSQAFASGNNGSVGSIGGTNATAVIADDITAGSGLGGHGVNSITFATGNLNSTAVTAGVTLIFYTASTTGTGPGSVFDTINLAPITMAASSVQLFTVTSAIPFFTMPSGTFWAGISYNDNGGTTGITTTQLGDLGMGVYAPPTVGTSNDYFYESSSGSTTGSANPAGNLLYFGGNPTADFGWDFSTLVIVPEPSSWILTSFAGIIALGAARMRAGFRRLAA